MNESFFQKAKKLYFPLILNQQAKVFKKKVLAAIKELDKNTKDAIRKKQLAATRALVLPASGKIGDIDLVAWQQTEAIMLQAGQIKRAVQVEKYLQKR
jgi:hypothetical protein